MEDSEFQAILVLSLVGGISTGLGLLAHYKLNQKYAQRETLKKQGQPYTASSLLENKDNFREPKLAMVQGVLVRESSLKHLEQHPEKLVKKLHKHKKIYSSQEKVSLQMDRSRSYVHNAPHYDKFTLLDENNLKGVQVVSPGDQAEGINVPQKRQLSSVIYVNNNRKEYFEKISYIAGEGTALTLMGIVTYDAKDNTVKLTKLSGFLAGGIQECMRFMNERISFLQSVRNYVSIIGGLCIGTLSLYAYMKLKSR